MKLKDRKKRIDDKLVTDLQSKNNDLELGTVTTEEAFEMLERADHISALRSGLSGKPHSASSQKISDAVAHQVDIDRKK